MKNLQLLLVVLMVELFSGCEKTQSIPGSNGKVELFMIETFSTIKNSAQIDVNSVVTKQSPLISYQDFLSYDSVQHEFSLSNKALDAINGLKHSVHGLPFAIKVNDTLVYTGYFWPSYSSASCDWVVIDPFLANANKKATVRLGYPGLIQGQTIEDKRNDKRILRIFKQDNKLK